MSVRVRFAPSPTGQVHIGNIRAAIFNWLHARHCNGQFLLRIEDTDRERSTKESERAIFEALRWVGLSWDEGPDIGGPFGPYRQSERSDIYRKHADELVAKKAAYHCFCTAQRLTELREKQKAAKSDFGYDGFCRHLPEAEVQAKLKAGAPNVIRLAVPEGETSFNDLVRGEVTFQNSTVDDQVLLKSDGFPTYHLANVVDDHLMQITHVLRAQEWIPSAPLHMIMYKAFGWDPPELVHLPMVLGADGHKLSKRHGATAVDEFRKAGYLPEALINYVSHLGCSFEDGRDLFPLADLERLFKVERLNKAPATFDYQKLEWYNGQYIRMKADGELRALVLPYLVEAGLLPVDAGTSSLDLVLGSMPLIKERLRFLTDAPIMMRYLFEEPPLALPEEFIPKKLDKARAAELLAAAGALLPTCDLWDLEATEAKYREEATRLGAKFGDLMMPLRVAVTGSRVSPPLFESIRLIGVPKAEARIARCLELLRS